MEKKKDLLSSFEKLSTEEWISAIEKYLKAKPYSSLYKEVEEGVCVAPFYRKEDLSGASAALPLHNNNWLITERFRLQAGNSKAVNQQILQALEKGVNALRIEIGGGCQPKDLKNALKGVYLSMVATQLQGAGLEVQPKAFIDLIAQLDREGQGSLQLKASATSVEILQQLRAKLPNWGGSCIELETTMVPAQQLAAVLTTVNNRVQELLEQGFSFEQAQHQLHFYVSIDDDYFLSIARLRALKRLWLAFLEAYDAKTANYPRIHVATQNTNADNYWNMIAATAQALAAATAQVYSIEVRPADEQATDFSRRIARNVQHVLKMESHLDQVIDPAAGSYYIENLSDQLVQQAWTLFLASNGGAKEA